MAPSPAGTLRRLAAAAYDGMLLLALLMLVTAVAQLATHGHAITRASVGPWEYVYRALLAATVVGYFGLGWTRHGQTLGMKAWHIRLECEPGTPPSWRRALLRLVPAALPYLALLGAAMLYVAHRIDAPRAALGVLPLALDLGCHALTGRGTLADRWSRTRIVPATAPDVEPEPARAAPPRV